MYGIKNPTLILDTLINASGTHNDFGNKVNDVGRSINDHIQARNFMKSEILEKLEHEFRVNMATNKKSDN